ncbi:MAG: hypothetical protein J6X61_04065 [Clostridia bacterium]|nr:hypothetical protein [Clostridia bacterium]
MTLAQLGQEYLEQERILRGRIDRLNEEMTLLSGQKKRDLSRRVALLYDMARNVHRIGVYLIGYYQEGAYGVF